MVRVKDLVALRQMFSLAEREGIGIPDIVPPATIWELDRLSGVVVTTDDSSSSDIVWGDGGLILEVFA